LALQAALGLDFLHRNNYIHMDFKASNVFVDLRVLTAVVSDLGLSRQQGGSCITGRGTGTPGL
jgi:serine/threonine protein kinase